MPCVNFTFKLTNRSYGMVLIEASKFGRPMITCTGTTYINEHNKTGLVVS